VEVSADIAVDLIEKALRNARPGTTASVMLDARPVLVPTPN